MSKIDFKNGVNEEFTSELDSNFNLSAFSFRGAQVATSDLTSIAQGYDPTVNFTNYKAIWDLVNTDELPDSGNLRGLSFSQDGFNFVHAYSSLGNTVVKSYELGQPFDLNTLVLTGTYTYTASLQFISFSTDGSIMFATSANPQTCVITSRALSTPWDVSTASYINGVDLETLGSVQLWSFGHKFSTDGTKLFVSSYFDFRTIATFTLSTAWDLSTLAFVTNFSIVTTPSISSIGDISFNDSGSMLYVACTSDSVTTIIQFSLGVPWSIGTYSEVSRWSSTDTSMDKVIWNKDDSFIVIGDGVPVTGNPSTYTRALDTNYTAVTKVPTNNLSTSTIFNDNFSEIEEIGEITHDNITEVFDAVTTGTDFINDTSNKYTWGYSPTTYPGTIAGLAGNLNTDFEIIDDSDKDGRLLSDSIRAMILDGETITSDHIKHGVLVGGSPSVTRIPLSQLTKDINFSELVSMQETSGTNTDIDLGYSNGTQYILGKFNLKTEEFTKYSVIGITALLTSDDLVDNISGYKYVSNLYNVYGLTPNGNAFNIRVDSMKPNTGNEDISNKIGYGIKVFNSGSLIYSNYDSVYTTSSTGTFDLASLTGSDSYYYTSGSSVVFLGTFKETEGDTYEDVTPFAFNISYTDSGSSTSGYTSVAALSGEKIQELAHSYFYENKLYVLTIYKLEDSGGDSKVVMTYGSYVPNSFTTIVNRTSGGYPGDRVTYGYTNNLNSVACYVYRRDLNSDIREGAFMHYVGSTSVRDITYSPGVAQNSVAVLTKHVTASGVEISYEHDLVSSSQSYLDASRADGTYQLNIPLISEATSIVKYYYIDSGKVIMYSFSTTSYYSYINNKGTVSFTSVPLNVNPENPIFLDCTPFINDLFVDDYNFEIKFNNEEGRQWRVGEDLTTANISISTNSLLYDVDTQWIIIYS